MRMTDVAQSSHCTKTLEKVCFGEQRRLLASQNVENQPEAVTPEVGFAALSVGRLMADDMLIPVIWFAIGAWADATVHRAIR